jgi:7-cyano-7-deazaguanine synthase
MSLTIDYGQKAARAEIAASKQACNALNLPHAVLIAQIGSVAAGDMSDQAASQHSANSEFWPFRNQYLVTLAAMYSIKHGYSRILIGTVATDCRHKDGTQRFVEISDRLLSEQEGGIRLAAPAISMTSTELVRQSKIEFSVLGWAHSCHIGQLACGCCRGCIKHSEVMQSLELQR